MSGLLQKINARLQHYHRDELMALIWDFLSDRDEDDVAEFLDLMRQKSRPAALEPLELEEHERIMERRTRLMHAKIDALIARDTDPSKPMDNSELWSPTMVRPRCRGRLHADSQVL